MAQIYGTLPISIIYGLAPAVPSSVVFAFPPQNPGPYQHPPTLNLSAGAPTPGPPKPVVTHTKIAGLRDERNQINPWFDLMHALPRRIELGRVLATTVIEMTVHNAYRAQTVTWNSFVNGAGAGTVLTGPTPPQILSPQESTVGLQLQITTDGVPVVDDTLDFGFTSPDLPIVPISFSRLVFFPIFPQEGFTEELGFLTDILESKNGTETRASVRRFPRVTYKLQFAEEDENLSLLHNYMLGRPGSTYGIPLWSESTVLTSAATTGDPVYNVRDTRYRQFEVGGVAVVYQGQQVYDIFQVAAFDQTTITPVNPAVLSLPAGTIVMPVRLATANAGQRGSRPPVNFGTLAVEFDVRDALEDLSDVTGWPTYNGALLIDDCNALGRGSVSEQIAARLIVIDGETGPIQKSSYAPNGRYSSRKQWAPQGIEKLWSVRGLLYALRGRQTSFYLPTNRNDLTPIATLSSGSTTLSVVFAGVTYVAGNGYRDHLRVTLTDGTELIREIVDVSGNEAQTEEYLEVDTGWPLNIPVEDVRRIEFLQRVRLDRDTISMRYEPGRPGARVTIPYKSVLGES